VFRRVLAKVPQRLLEQVGVRLKGDGARGVGAEAPPLPRPQLGRDLARHLEAAGQDPQEGEDLLPGAGLQDDVDRAREVVHPVGHMAPGGAASQTQNRSQCTKRDVLCPAIRESD